MGVKPLVLTLSSNSYSATPATGSTTVTAYYGGLPITDLTSSMVSKSGNMSSVTVNSSGVITMRYYSNTSTASTVTSTMTITYSGQTKTFTITQAKDYKTGTTTSSSTSSKSFFSYNQDISLNITLVKTATGYQNEALSNAVIGRVYTTTTYYDVYASGRRVQTSQSSGLTSTTTANIPAGFYVTDQTTLSSGTYIQVKASSVKATESSGNVWEIKYDGDSRYFTIYDYNPSYPEFWCRNEFQMYVNNMSNYPDSVVTLTNHRYNSMGLCRD